MARILIFLILLTFNFTTNNGAPSTLDGTENTIEISTRPETSKKHFIDTSSNIDEHSQQDILPKLTHPQDLLRIKYPEVESSTPKLLTKLLTHKEPVDWTGYDIDRPSRHRDRYAGDPILDIKLEYCKAPAQCVPMGSNYSTCMGTQLPYNSTTLDLTDLKSQEEVQEKLLTYQNLRHVPKCWAVIQPFLCSLYRPKCEKDEVDLPSKDMCNITRGPCKILYGTPYFPSLLRCEDDHNMPLPPACKNDLREIRFNTTGQCLKPLIQTDNPTSFYKGVDGCGLQCKNPLYTDSEHDLIHKWVAWGAVTCLMFNLFTVVTLLIDWHSANRYPALGIFYINCCFLVSCIGWLAQFYGGDSREEIVCRKDGTLRLSEPSTGENLSCVVIFILVYYFLVAAMVWFVIFSYACYITCRSKGEIPVRLDKKGAYFHLAAWSLPLILTITTMALSEIDGNSVSGICFVGNINTTARAALVLVPLCVALIVALYFLLRGLFTLIYLKIGSKEVISTHGNNKISENIVRIALNSFLILVFGVVTIMYHIYQFSHSSAWQNELHSYIICRLARAKFPDHCQLKMRPDVDYLKYQIAALFLTGIGMSSWVLKHSSIDIWIGFIRRKFDCEVKEPIQLQKHKVIARAYSKRKTYCNDGRLSISFPNTHTDPVGLNFELNSAGSHDLSSTWAAALPRLVNRRYALTGAPAGSISSQRCNSHDSEVSFSVRRVSVESRRNSFDSQVSVQVAELKATRKHVGTSRRRPKGNRHRREKRPRSSGGRKISRRESSTSMESQLETQIQQALGLASHANLPSFAPNLSRRSANAGLDRQQIRNLIASGKFILPISPHSESDDEDNNSVTKSENGPAISDNESSQNSENPELLRLFVQSVVQSSLNSGISVATQHNGCKSVDVAVQADARDIATQTLQNLDSDAEDVSRSISDLQPVRSKSRCVNQGTQMSPVLVRHGDAEKSPAPVKPKRTSLTKRISPTDTNVKKHSDLKLCENRKSAVYETEPLKSSKYKNSVDNSCESESLINDSKSDRSVRICKSNRNDH